MDQFATIVIVVALLLNFVATILVWRSSSYTTQQKRIQTLLIWLLPFLGALLCLIVMRETRRRATAASKSNSPHESPPGVGSHYD